MIKSLHTYKGGIWSVIAVILAVIFTTLTIDPAAAQQKRRSLFDVLFGRKQPRITQPVRPHQQRRVIIRQGQQQQIYGTQPMQSRQRPAAAPKNPTAKRIVIVGDFVAGALADGLTDMYKDNPEMNVISRTEGSSGLVRDDYYNWPIKISDIIARDKPDVIVLVIGANDRQSMRLANKNFDVSSPEWASNYQGRINALALKLQQSGAQWLWVGLPSFKQKILSDSFVSFNALYKQATEKSGGHFIDIWSGFVDDNGHFALSGYDSNGQTARLRNNDGISFTIAGKHKLAFYADQLIAPLLANQISASGGMASIPIVGTSARRDIRHIAPTGLWDISPAASSLYGAQPASGKPHNNTGFYPQSGRADDFRSMPDGEETR
ncbi:MAG: Hypothetical protein BHV28_06390 [Candidatus Tokpelaia hoelldobleri]|uniref:DUF459 domain-containing protein n=1 Tax=Candidatus Tokpelaia hoelldobleri TaxID=1902579 RepID=A0A1U9JU06_9HYPH|nr:MAG: Hypothetical protein BHV28_06390 [Candidatus Tokpelaia hoelldoblerii]